MKYTVSVFFFVSFYSAISIGSNETNAVAPQCLDRHIL